MVVGKSVELHTVLKRNPPFETTPHIALKQGGVMVFRCVGGLVVAPLGASGDVVGRLCCGVTKKKGCRFTLMVSLTVAENMLKFGLGLSNR